MHNRKTPRHGQKVIAVTERTISRKDRTKEGRNPFTPKKFFCAKKKEINKRFESKILCYYF